MGIVGFVVSLIILVICALLWADELKEWLGKAWDASWGCLAISFVIAVAIGVGFGCNIVTLFLYGF